MSIFDYPSIMDSYNRDAEILRNRAEDIWDWEQMQNKLHNNIVSSVSTPIEYKRDDYMYIKPEPAKVFIDYKQDDYMYIKPEPIKMTIPEPLIEFPLETLSCNFKTKKRVQNGLLFG